MMSLGLLAVGTALVYCVADSLLALTLAPPPAPSDTPSPSRKDLVGRIKLGVRKAAPWVFAMGCGALIAASLAFGGSWDGAEPVGVALLLLSFPLLVGTAFSPVHFLQSNWQWAFRGAIFVAYGIQWLHPALALLFAGLVVWFYRLQGSPIHISITDKALVLVGHFFGSLFAVTASLCPAAGLNEVHFFWLLTAIVGAFYFKPGFAKIVSGWTGRNRLSNLSVAAECQNRWLAKWPLRSQMRHVVDRWNGVILVSTAILEMSALGIGLHPAFLWVFCIAMTGFHLIVFAMSGILFWKWIVFLFAFAAVATAWGSFGVQPMLTCAGAAIMIAFVSRMIQGLTWFDSAASHRFEVAGVDREGRETVFAPEDFGPFDFPFAQARFNYLVDRPTLVGCLGGVWSSDDADAVAQCRTRADYDAMLGDTGKNAFDEERASELDRVLRCFAESRYPLKRPVWNRFFPMSPHIWSMIPSFKKGFQSDAIERIRIYYSEFLREEGDDPIQVRRVLIRELEVGEKAVGSLR